jgi:hypothetical protein
VIRIISKSKFTIFTNISINNIGVFIIKNESKVIINLFDKKEGLKIIELLAISIEFLYINDNKGHPDLNVNSTVSYSLSRKSSQKIAKYSNSIEIANNSIIFKRIGCDLYGELSLDFTNFIDSIISFGSTFKNIRPSLLSNRFDNNLAFIFANENSNIIYTNKYGELRRWNFPNHIVHH